jgi:hypothetical protein
VLHAVRGILDASEKPPVIVVVSDHGGHLVGSQPDNGRARDWRDSFGNLFLGYTPDRAEIFPDDVSLVNVLPRLFNAYLDTELPYSPDTSFNEGGTAAVEP